MAQQKDGQQASEYERLMRSYWPCSGPAEVTASTMRCQKRARERTTSEASSASSSTGTGAKRGRPSAETVQRLIEEGLKNPDAKNKCNVCGRNFDRAKALKTHVMAHKGEAPHRCTFPGCNTVATQSGNKKTHERRHAGDFIYICPHPGCGKEFMHSNRDCEHEVEADGGRVVKVKVRVIGRPDKCNTLRPDPKECYTQAHYDWVVEYAQKNNKIYLPPSTPARPAEPATPATVRTPKKPQRVRKELKIEVQENITPDTQAREVEPGSSFTGKLKRRWLIQASQDSSRPETRHLAEPLQWSEPNPNQVLEANLTRPTVLVGVQPVAIESDDEQRAALALIALSSADSPANRLANSPKKSPQKRMNQSEAAV
ncbi:Hypothetical predicted protein [Cloeon dipterum]|uniref:C2H2-type domain-containing protein n=1 Tax=Cloeon dipterum TaxID=197152 RepID=A0A8S1D408_9INSE|nr:Hypothetical predicted protein [Cloeon dipterum]